jgi:hypothetical protein
MRVRRKGIAVVAALSLTLFAAACGGDDDDDDSAASTETTAATSSETTTASGDVTTPAEFEDYIGLTEEEATAKAEADGKVSRVVSRNGEDLAVTMDYNAERLNFTIVDDKVTLVTLG